MQDKEVALVTGVNQGIGLRIRYPRGLSGHAVTAAQRSSRSHRQCLDSRGLVYARKDGNDPLVMDVAMLAERELSAFFRAVSELHGPAQAEAAAGDWLHQLAASEGLPASSREWRAITIAAAAQLASRVTCNSSDLT